MHNAVDNSNRFFEYKEKLAKKESLLSTEGLSSLVTGW